MEKRKCRFDVKYADKGDSKVFQDDFLFNSVQVEKEGDRFVERQKKVERDRVEEPVFVEALEWLRGHEYK